MIAVLCLASMSLCNLTSTKASHGVRVSMWEEVLFQVGFGLITARPRATVRARLEAIVPYPSYPVPLRLTNVGPGAGYAQAASTGTAGNVLSFIITFQFKLFDKETSSVHADRYPAVNLQLLEKKKKKKKKRNGLQIKVLKCFQVFFRN